MLRLCDRNYDGGSLYSRKMINNIPCCANCEQPIECHGKSVEQRALFWAVSGSTGISSKAIMAHMTGNPKTDAFGMMPPSDADDRGRCIRLLYLIPEWISRLPEMVQYDKSHPQQGIVISSSGVSANSNSWQKQIPMILSEGKF